MSQIPQSTGTDRHRDRGGSMPEARKRISLDWWTVLAAFAAALLVKVGVLPAIPW
jgi:hypothetical protein